MSGLIPYRLSGVLVLLVFAVTCLGSIAQALAQVSAVEEMLRQRLAGDPQSASTWRLLGRMRYERGDYAGALDACRKSLAIDDRSASSHFDLARALLATGDGQQAAQHFRRVVDLAPQSDYARQAGQQLESLPGGVVLASHEQQINRLTNEIADTDAEFLEPFRFRVEFGALYNSNVQLAPISREIFPGQRESFQVFVSPQVEWRAFETGPWSGGLTFDSYFNWNESDVSDFNLQSVQPGAFIERIDQAQHADWVSRLAYGYAHDAFAGDSLARRNAVALSVNRFAASGAVTTVYYQIDYSDFLDDGLQPAVTSLDGWTQTCGASHGWDPGCGAWERVRLGFDLQWADLTGDDYAYDGVFAYLESEISLTEVTWIVFQAGWGYRDYDAFTGTPSRDESIWRGGLELHHALNPCWSVVGLFTYDRFDADNAAFAADRYLAGTMLVYER